MGNNVQNCFSNCEDCIFSSYIKNCLDFDVFYSLYFHAHFERKLSNIRFEEHNSRIFIFKEILSIILVLGAIAISNIICMRIFYLGFIATSLGYIISLPILAIPFIFFIIKNIIYETERTERCLHRSLFYLISCCSYLIAKLVFILQIEEILGYFSWHLLIVTFIMVFLILNFAIKKSIYIIFRILSYLLFLVEFLLKFLFLSTFGMVLYCCRNRRQIFDSCLECVQESCHCSLLTNCCNYCNECDCWNNERANRIEPDSQIEHSNHNLERRVERRLTIQEITDGFKINTYNPQIYSVTNCIICLESFTETDRVVQLKCFKTHIFHETCIKEWIKTSRLCPDCRKKIDQNL